jgi:hypothetical protein
MPDFLGGWVDQVLTEEQCVVFRQEVMWKHRRSNISTMVDGSALRRAISACTDETLKSLTLILI